jgi:hypothetical protein
MVRAAAEQIAHIAYSIAYAADLNKSGPKIASQTI